MPRYQFPGGDCCVFSQDGQAVIEDFKNYPMPGTQGEISIQEFFDTAAEYLEPVIDKSDKIGFCFSYPTEIFPNRDGGLIRFVKEVQVRDSEGAYMGRGLLNAVRARGHKEEKKIVLVNDAVTTLIGGKAAFPDRQFDSYIGFIWGTGINTCYMEENSNILKAAGEIPPKGTMLINVESGGYSKAPRGDLDELFDSSTVNPGSYQFEKMISGCLTGRSGAHCAAAGRRRGAFQSFRSGRVKGAGPVCRPERLTSFCFTLMVTARCPAAVPAEKRIVKCSISWWTVLWSGRPAWWRLTWRR